MMKKILLAFVFSVIGCLMLTAFVSAATTNEFGEIESLENIDLKGMNEDTVARVVIVDSSGEFHTYPTSYITVKGTTLGLNFSPITAALGETISKDNVIRIEVPSCIVTINYGGLSGFKNLVEIKFLEDSMLETVGGGGFYDNPVLEKINLPASLKEFTGTQIFNKCYALHTVTFAENSQLKKIPDNCFQNCTSLKKLVLPHSVTTLGNKLFDTATVLEEFYLSPNLVDFGAEHFAWKQSGVLKIFAPAQLFENKEAVGIVDFSWWNNDGCLPSMVIFITGTESQAQSIVLKSTYHKLTNAVVSQWDSNKTTDDYVPAKGWAIVYGYSVCDAFYGGEHILTGEDSAKVVDFLTEIRVGDICTREGCGMGTTSKVIAPIFEDLGISVSEKADANGKYSITRGYKINRGAYNEYLEYGVLEFGLVAAAVDVAGSNPIVIADGKIAPACEKVLTAGQEKFAHDYVDFKLTGLSDTLNGKQVVLSMYVYDGSKIDYLSNVITVDVGE